MLFSARAMTRRKQKNAAPARGSLPLPSPSLWNGIEDWVDSQPRDADGRGERANGASHQRRPGMGKENEPNERTGAGRCRCGGRGRGPAGRPNGQLKKRHVAFCAPYAHAALTP